VASLSMLSVFPGVLLPLLPPFFGLFDPRPSSLDDRYGVSMVFGRKVSVDERPSFKTTVRCG